MRKILHNLWTWLSPFSDKIQALELRVARIEDHLNLETSEGRAVSAFTHFVRKEDSE